eukprot:2327317-Prymnesium_polylepis.1
MPPPASAPPLKPSPTKPSRIWRRKALSARAPPSGLAESSSSARSPDSLASASIFATSTLGSW